MVWPIHFYTKSTRRHFFFLPASLSVVHNTQYSVQSVRLDILRYGCAQCKAGFKFCGRGNFCWQRKTFRDFKISNHFYTFL